MKYIILILSLFLVSCSNQSDSIEWFWYKDNWVDFSHIETQELPQYKFTEIKKEDFDYTTYNSGKILEIHRLDELNRQSDKLNLDTMQVEPDYEYTPVSSCTFVLCLRYRIRVQYPSWDTVYEYVTEIQYRDNTPNELIDDSEFYKNK